MNKAMEGFVASITTLWPRISVMANNALMDIILAVGGFLLEKVEIIMMAGVGAQTLCPALLNLSGGTLY